MRSFPCPASTSSPSLRRTPSRRVTARDAPSDRTSLVPETIRELEADLETKELHDIVQTVGQAALTARERRLRQRSLETLSLPSFAKLTKERSVSAWNRKPTAILQVNVGLYCNQACSHCHVESSPLRKETLSREMADHVRAEGSAVWFLLL